MAETVSYVVQVQEFVDMEPEPVLEMWRDLATVRVPVRTKRKTVIRKALEDNSVDVPEGGLQVRLLDGDTADPITVFPPAAEPGPRELRL